MFNSTRFQIVLALGIGCLLGYVVATGRVLPSFQAQAAVEVPTSAEGVSKPTTAPAAGSCCLTGAGRELMLADASTEIAQVTAGRPGRGNSGKKPNIVFIMGDDIGWFNIGAYHRGIMAGRTPNLDKLAAQGVMFTDYYAEASCTAGRANFITGQLPIRTGLTTVGQAGATIGMPEQAPTIATALKEHGLCHGPIRQEPLGRLE